MADQANVSDADLVQGIQKGLQAAGTDLFEKYSARVYYLALRKLRSYTEAEDVRAETFLRVFRAIQNQQVRSPESLSLYILGTARNVILETIRNPQWVARASGLIDLPSPEQDPEIDKDVQRAVEVTIGRLKPKEREFLRLHYYEDLPKEEIARRIGIDAERVRLLKHRTLKSFREIYLRLKKITDTKGGGSSLQC